MALEVQTGRAYPLGATWDGEGTNFALFSQHAEAVELCLFDPADEQRETGRVRLFGPTDGVWHVYVPGVGAGARYAYRVYGPYEPRQGHRFNPAKLLLDPYARAITGALVWDERQCGYRRGAADGPRGADARDSAGTLPRCVVVDPSFEWGDDRAPRTPWSRTVIYECHVRGLTVCHPDVPPELRGTYRALAAEPVIEHLRRLGVTAVELLPVQQSFTEEFLTARGLTNYWGYNPIGFFAPDARYATRADGGQVSEFQQMVRGLHAAGIEVILDVVFNHSGEGDHRGPTLSLRGIDNASYYLLDPGDRRRYVDTTGCGNTLNAAHPRVLQMIMDCLRWWVGHMHVDGFRFDLAPALARDERGVDPHGRIFAAIQQDPLLAGVKLIAEPWDLGEGGYRLGAFPPGWAEWNARYRDTVRRFWRGDPGQRGEMASRLTGSSDLFAGRSASASINYVAAHDGFTLADLVSYERKHNEANGLNNRDGTDANYSTNCGVEGPTDREDVRALRRRMQRNFLATLAVSLGVPMVWAGDEMGRSQAGNNNAYCQDNEIGWVAWPPDEHGRRLMAFAAAVFSLRQENAVFRRRAFLKGRAGRDGGPADALWLHPDGRPMTPADWEEPAPGAFALLLDATAADEVDACGRRACGRTVLCLFNAAQQAVRFTLPEGAGWRVRIDTADEHRPARPRDDAGEAIAGSITVAARSLVVLEKDGP